MKHVDQHYWNILLKDVGDAFESLGSPTIIWYRGVSSPDHDLSPSLLRYDEGLEKEKLLFERYQQWSSYAIATENLGRPATDWDVLFEMQHYGIPTRLLDWTEVFGIAVFFAVLNNKTTDSAIYMLNPTALNKKAGRTELSDFDTTQINFRKVFWDNDPFGPTYPLAISPRQRIPRLRAQRGRFTVHGIDAKPLNHLAPDCIRKVIIKKEAKVAIDYFLNVAGINEFSIFPDVLGVAPFIRNLVGLRH